MKPLILIIIAGSLIPASRAQSLFERRPVTPPVEAAEGGASSAAAVDDQGLPLKAVSLYAIEPPEPRIFAPHDQITIIISERNKVERTQTLETEKEFQLDAAVQQWIELTKLLEFQVKNKDTDGLPQLGMDFSSEVNNEGTYEREDTLTARVTARVVEVKPNGVLLIEARTTMVTDEEIQTITLAGYCRQEDVTTANTVQSNQLYDMVLNIQHEGDVRKAAKKGFIPSFIEGLFNF